MASSSVNTGLDTTLVNSFNGFLEHEFDNGRYSDKVDKMLNNGEIRLMINLNDFRIFDPILAQRFIKNPSLHLPSFTKALTDFINKIQPQTKERTNTEYFFGFEGSLGSHHVSPRELTTDLLRSLVCVEGIVVKCSTIKPKVVESVHYCEKTGEERRQVYKDETSAVSEAASSFYPTRDLQGNPYSTEFGLSRYRDFQTIVIQEMPERAPPGQLPRSVEVILHDDLVDRAKPGDRLRVYGIYRALPKTNAGQKHTKAVFRTALLANCVKMLNKEIHGPVLTEEDIQNIKKISTKKGVFDLMAKSLAPSIYGHEYMKKAVLLQLLGGVEKNLENGTHIRGDINVLMVGDPSTAKSQLLRFVLHTAPLAISTTGRGASGVGLTAAVTSDAETGEKRLEAGAMVLADRGIVCIDEFDKMSTEDRVAIHEVMEQQTVTIAKAGIHTTLNARCSVLAAANPVYGKYDRRKKPWENIGLPDSLLSRFDLLFIVLDKSEPEHDRMIAEHVLRMHRYKQIDENANSHLPNVVDEDDDKESLKTPVYQKHDRLLHGDRKKGEKLLSIPFIKKFLLYAKTRIKPVLDEEAQRRIIDAFADLRSREDIKTLPITARTLETMIRLSVAHAKSRLSTSVSLDDAEEALKIMRYAMYHDASPDVADNKKAQIVEPATVTDVEAESVQEMDVVEDDNLMRPDETSQAEEAQGTSDTRTRRKRKASEMAEDSESESQRSAKRPKTTRTDSDTRENIFGNKGQAGSARYQKFRRLVSEALKQQYDSSVPVEDVVKYIHSRAKADPFSAEEIQSLLEKMDAEQTTIMLADGMIHVL